jgi:molecular chaperone HtpG
LHGIEIPSTLFPESWRRKNNQVKISWPFPLVIVVDIAGNNDLDLNSPRTEIILSEKWIDFEEKLAFTICNEIAKQVTPEYWNELKDILIATTQNELFLRSINKVVISKE